MSASRADAEQPSRPLHATIVSGNADTLDGLHRYLTERSISTNGTRFIERTAEMTPPSASAVIVFPDDFPWEAVLAAVTEVRLVRPNALVVLVTSTPARLERVPWPDAELGDPLVVAKPVWGWTILDAIRTRLDRRTSSHLPRRTRA